MYLRERPNESVNAEAAYPGSTSQRLSVMVGVGKCASLALCVCSLGGWLCVCGGGVAAVPTMCSLVANHGEQART